MSIEGEAGVEEVLRELAPRVLGIVVRRYGDFDDAEDAVQEAVLAAATAWPDNGMPANPAGWLVRVASRRMTDHYRTDVRRKRREEVAAAQSIAAPDDPNSATDDTLILVFMCCHRSLTPASAIPLTLRAVGGLSTREIANAFLVPEATMAQRISRAKATISASAVPFRLPPDDERPEALRSVRHVLYLLFNEGYASSSGSDLQRTDLSSEAIRLARLLHDALPDDPETAGLLALMLLNDARRPARTSADGELVPLAEQDRSLWMRADITAGLQLVTSALQRQQIGEYQLQAAIAALHDEAPRHEDTKWSEIASLYALLERMTGNPMVRLNRAVAVAMVDGPAAGLALLDDLDERLGDHHRLHAARAHLLEQAGDDEAAITAFRAAADRTANLRERNYLVLQAARLAATHRNIDGNAR